MPTYVHCPACRRAYDAAGGPCPSCPVPVTVVEEDPRLTAALDEIARLRAAVERLAARAEPVALARIPRAWRDTVTGLVARAVHTVRATIRERRFVF